MYEQISREVSNIRDRWTDRERENRRHLADAMQLQLRHLVVLSELSEPSQDGGKQLIEMANAC